jgi:uncharacterized repeat protein (TIGR03803 family)
MFDTLAACFGEARMRSLAAKGLRFLGILMLAGGPLSSLAQVQTLHSFSGPDGTTPQGGVVLGGDGALYGTTVWGGNSTCPYVGCGTVFRITSNGKFETLVLFDGTNGNSPNALVKAGGAFYGTTFGGGANGLGIVFEVDKSGTLTTLFTFDNGAAGGQPRAGLAKGPGGELYGTTSEGGADGCGAVFSITLDGAVSVLAAIPCSTGTPFGPLVLGKGGNLYGTSLQGFNGNCAPTCGTVFRVTPDGEFTTAVQFNDSDGADPWDEGLMKGPHGVLYGTTYGDGTGADWGTVFTLSPGGTFATLVTFNGQNGSNPQGTLLRGRDGFLYGTTSTGGTNFFGTVFQMTPTGALTTIADFDFSNGTAPTGNIAQKRDGEICGTTQGGGSGSYGTVWCVAPPSPQR